MNSQASILFDIDGTLLFARGVGRIAFAASFRGAYGVEYPDIGAISFVGATDSGVIRQMAARCSVPNSPAREEHFFFLLARHLDAAMDARPPQIFPGVPELLRELNNRGYRLGLVTGNIRATAWAKVRHAGVDSCFSFGAYGDESEDRNEITRLAIGRAPEGGTPRLLVGDTPRDIEAAHRNGLAALAVGTGWVSLDDLTRSGADAVIQDFSDTEQTIRLIESVLEQTTVHPPTRNTP
ncbi:MAG: HAD family hydrolase [Kiritimatiellae bacterium]|nr:HAD family hydrolase [Kiritimatiellia bacterium]